MNPRERLRAGRAVDVPANVSPVGGAPPAPDMEALYRRLFMPLVRRVTWRHRVPREDAVDLVQDAFALALVKLASEAHARAWFCQVVDYMAVNHKRKTRRRAGLMRRWGAAAESSGAAIPGDVGEEI